MTIDDLIHKIKELNPQSDPELVLRAFEYAEKAHRGQMRHSGEEFIQHPLEVALILSQLELDNITVAAALLHDVVEDTGVTLQELEKNFGHEIAQLVDGVTKLSRIEYKSKEEQQAENLRKMFLAMAKDIRVILIKLADRLHNMRTLKFHTEVKQRECAEETMEIFAPLANRLGMQKIKWELEDLAFRYLEPEQYYSLVEGIAMKRLERETYINFVMEEIKNKLTGVGIHSDIGGRPKHFYSIFHKMKTQHKELVEIYDLTAVRVIVDSVKDCYAALGIIHTMWKPIPGRFKDYIAMPKPNMYQSLHTTLVGPQGEPFEVQIRTWEMHRTAEYGIAAHWKYKENPKASSGDFEQKLSWLRQLLEWQNDLRDAREFMESLKIDLFADTVFVFTPKGDVVELPADSCPVDYAYRVHTDVGHRCVGAKINGRIIPLNTKLSNGDIVEILTSKQGNGPSRDWLSFVKTSQAKNRIRQWFKKEKRDENLIRGKEMADKEIRKLGLEPADVLKSDRLLEIAKSFNFVLVEDMYTALGDGAITVNKLLNKLKDDIAREMKKAGIEPEENKPGVKPYSQFGKPSQGVLVKGVDNILIRFSRCCNPLPGDEITGYITKGRGVSVHRADCVNMHHQVEGRFIEVKWDERAQTTYQVEVEIHALDRPRLTLDVMNAVVDTKTTINAVNARATKNKMAVIHLKIEIRNLEHFEYVSSKIKRVKDVLEVRRVTPGGPK
ncbi:MAG TPA: bifunctional (p)ppGpp synthetase/guanosine-3',5'-bis(diphosphate) 3'-pyrophosphohydrolase [Candidatus Deferrimicrobium sp.]|nr:bifunctional (p)ppGpp synthetase/guanosine-3',5'-bis(diphosphate) 3'-pyrophosphohydrolase [Candidatus Deferrimicrobium sp.]